MRYVNVAKILTPDGNTIYLDLDVVNTTEYTPYDASRNGMNGRFAQISFPANTEVGLRVYVRRSCARADSCSYCDDVAFNPTESDREACYTNGCGCFGHIVTTAAECTGIAREARRSNYECDGMDAPTMFPSGSLVGFSVYDLNTGPANECVEQLTIQGYDYFKTPLRPSSDNQVNTTIDVDLGAHTFTGTVPGLFENVSNLAWTPNVVCSRRNVDHYYAVDSDDTSGGQHQCMNLCIAYAATHRLSKCTFL